jgi:hypothetical protein
MSVYFIRVMPDGPIKIGTTNGNVARRVKALQQTSPHILKWIGFFPGGRTEEAEAHKLLKNSHLRGEWFHPTKEVLAFISQKCPSFDERQATAKIFHEEHRAVIVDLFPPYARDRHIVLQRIAKASGTDIALMSRWVEGRATVTAEQARAASEYVKRNEAAQ